MKGFRIPAPSNTSRVVVLESPTTTDTSFNQSTIWAWLKLTADTDPNFWWCKGDTSNSTMPFYARFNTGFNVFFSRATTNSEIQTNQAQYSLNVMQFFAITLNISGSTAATSINIYVGGLNTPATEVSYTARTTGVGALATSADGNFLIGNRVSPFSKSLNGTVYEMGMIRRYLSLREVQQLQFASFGQVVVPDTSFYIPMGTWGQTSSDTSVVNDLSGSQNGGGVVGTGITLGDGLFSRTLGHRGQHQIYTAAAASDVLGRGMSNIGQGIVASTGGGHSGLHPIEAGYIA